MQDWAAIYGRLKERIESFGVMIHAERLALEITGVFDGPSITTNTNCDLEMRCYSIAHCFGHVAQWSLDPHRQQELYDELNDAKANRLVDPVWLARVLERFRAYEEEASEYATWLLMETGNEEVLQSFTSFARADIEAIVCFHRDAVSPVWSEFFAAWKERVARGELAESPFLPRPVPSFRPVRIEPQQVIQAIAGHHTGKSGIRPATDWDVRNDGHSASGG